MKRTEITAVETMDGKIRITGIKNVASIYEIGQEFGGEVRRVYSGGVPKYKESSQSIEVTYENYTSETISNGDVYSKEEFAELIGILKSAGNRLQSIVKGSAEKKPFTVII